MSKGKEKAPRYGKLASIRQPAVPASVEAPSVVPEAPAQAPDQLEPFSAHLMGRTKRLLKQAAAKEGRKQYELLQEAVAAYLAEKHADLK